MVQKRSIATCIILSIITIGIYGLYWVAKITDETKLLAKDDNSLPSGGMVVLLTIVTCGIYSYYWAYKIGQIQYKAEKDHNIEDAKDNSIMFLVLEIVLSIVGWALMQNENNKMAK